MKKFVASILVALSVLMVACTPVVKAPVQAPVVAPVAADVVELPPPVQEEPKSVETVPTVTVEETQPVTTIPVPTAQ